jgi:hypothetical protein
VVADAADALASDCETVDRPIVPVTDPPVTTAPPTTTPAPTTPTATPAPTTAPARGTTPEPVSEPRPPAPLTDPPAVSIGQRSVTASASGAVGIALGCPADAAGACSGSIALTMTDSARRSAGGGGGTVTAARRRRIVKITKGRRFRIAKGARKTVTLRLSRRGRRALAQRGRMAVRAVVALRAGGGRATTSTYSLTVRAERRGAHNSRR